MSHHIPNSQAHLPVTRRSTGLGLALALTLGQMGAAGTATAAQPAAGEAAISTSVATLEQIREDHARIRNAAVRNILIVGTVCLAGALIVLIYAGRQRRAQAAAEARQRASEAAFRAVAGAAQDAIVLSNERGEISYWNRAAEELFGMTPAMAIGRTLRSLFADEAGLAPDVDALVRSAGEGAAIEHGRWEAVHLSGHRIPVRTTLASLDPGTGLNTLAVLRQGCSPHECAYELSVANVILDNANESIVITDAAGTTLRVNPAYCQLTGYSPEEIIGKNQNILNAGRHERSFFEAMWEALLQEGRWEGKIWNRRKDGTLYLEHLTIVALPMADGSSKHYVGIFSDITHKGLDPTQIGELAFYDPLTGLATRALLIDHLSEAMRHSKRSGRHVVLFYINLDDFSAINQQFGHSCGDDLLKNFAERLENTVRQEDTVARPGGDEFAVIMREMASLEDVPRVADKLLARLSGPYAYAGHTVPLTASIGVSLYPTHDDNSERLVTLAWESMNQAKSAGKNRWVIHQPRQEDADKPAGSRDH